MVAEPSATTGVKPTVFRRSIKAGETAQARLDCGARTLSFAGTDGVFHLAFSDLPVGGGRLLYPAVSVSYGAAARLGLA